MARCERRAELTVMSGIAILFVLGIHSSGSALTALYPTAVGYAETDYFLRFFSNLVSPAVPMFLFAAGFKYALHDKDTPYFIFLKKRLPRVLMSFFVINTLFWALDSIVWMERFDPVLLLKTYISSWMGNTVAYPLWYIPMYCCVIIACPLVNRVIKKPWVRFVLYLMIGLIQRYLATMIPAVGAYPIMFISYPVFFEMGSIACEKNWGARVQHKEEIVAIYVGIVAVVSYALPKLSVDVKYVLYFLIGSPVFYLLSLLLKGNRILHYLGEMSYPLFLLHEPVIERCTSVGIKHFDGVNSLGFVSVWIVCVFVTTVVVIWVLQRMKVNKVLWEFKVKV